MDEYLESLNDDMVGALERLRKELAKVRTGRATPKLVEGVQVQVASYGTTMPLNQLATIQAPDARLLVLTPWDKATIHDIERAIVAAGLGLNPSNDGQVVRLPVPPLTKERRDDLIKTCKKNAEESKVAVRHVRREYNDIFRAAEKDSEISEDEMHRLLKQVQEITDAHIKKVDEVVEAKEAEVMEV